MRTSQMLHLQTIILLYLTTFAAAWPLHWPRWLPELDSLVVRADSSSSNSPATNTASQTTAASPSATGATTTAAKTNNGGATTTYAIGTAKPPAATGNGTATITYSTAFDPVLPAGGVSMMTPSIAAGSQYYKIGDFVTFGWNYTSLLATPTAVNVMATCTANSQLYTIATNVTVTANGTNGVLWDTAAYQSSAAGIQNPLLTQTYTLIIYDAASSITAASRAGYLAVANSYGFGMYAKQPYQDLGEFKCATCSGAMGSMEQRAMVGVVGMAAITVLSFSWFVGGTGIIW